MLIGARNAAWGRKRKPYDAEVEYLESTGTQYIDLGTIIPPDADFEFTGSIVRDLTNGCIFGESYGFIWGANNPGYSLVTTSNGQIYLRYGDSTATMIGLTSIGLGNTFTVSLVGSTLKVDGQSVATVERISIFSKAVNSMGIFKRNYIINDTVSSYSAIRINRLKFDNLRDLIPVRKGGVGYMYDKVSGKLFGNDGTGDFIVGPDIIDYTAKDYVQDGLVAMWDGIENAGWGVHDANATTWVDLADNGFSIPVNTAKFTWNANSIESPNSAFIPLAAQSGAFSSNAGTIEAVFSIKNTAFSGSFGRVWAKNTVGLPNDRLAVLISRGGLSVAVQCGLISSSKFSETNIATISANSIVSTSFYRADTSNMGIFINGTDHALQGFSGVDVASGELLFFGDNTAALGNNIFGSIYSVRSYSRALTAEEIEHNNKIDKARFGL